MSGLLSRFNISTIIAFMSSIMIAISLAIVGAIVYSVVSTNAQSEAVLRQNTSLRVAATIMERDLPGTKVTWGADGNIQRIVADPIPASFDGHQMIDVVGRMTSETATIFGWDPSVSDFIRRTTNIVKPDGNRAVGTPLGKTGAVYPVLTKGNTFRGQAVILGKPYFTIYQPIFSSTGGVIGILYAGVERDKIMATVTSTMTKFLMAVVPVLIVAMFLTIFITKRLLRPIADLAKVTESIAEDRLDLDVPHVNRNDEIGIMAKAVLTLRGNSQERRSLAQAQDAAEEQRKIQHTNTLSLIDQFRGQVQDLLSSVSDTAHGLTGTSRNLSSNCSLQCGTRDTHPGNLAGDER